MTSNKDPKPVPPYTHKRIARSDLLKQPISLFRYPPSFLRQAFSFGSAGDRGLDGNVLGDLNQAGVNYVFQLPSLKLTTRNDYRALLLPDGRKIFQHKITPLINALKNENVGLGMWVPYQDELMAKTCDDYLALVNEGDSPMLRAFINSADFKGVLDDVEERVGRALENFAEKYEP